MAFEPTGTAILTTALTGLPNEMRLRWVETVPVNTSVTVETAVAGETGGVPNEPGAGDWAAQTNGQIVSNIPGGNLTGLHLWLRITLTTTDGAVTPEIEEPWLEDPTAPQDKILLTMLPLKRFHNVEGSLAVNYNGAIGTLAGVGGPANSFEVAFAPEGLEQVPNPFLVEHVAATLQVYQLTLNPIYHSVVGDGPDPTDNPAHMRGKYVSGAGNNEKLGATVANYVLELIHVSLIDP
jgi:hypothetical protein